MAEEEVSLPGGRKVPRDVVIGAVAVTAGIVGYAWWRKRRSAADSGPTVLTVDPNDAFGAVDRVPTGGSDNVDLTKDPDTLTTDGEWTAAGVEYMGDHGWEAATVQVALGNYLAGLKLKPGPPVNEADIVRAVRGRFGAPPVAGDLPIRMEEAGTTTPGTGGGSGGLDAPKNLRVTGTTGTSVSLAWDPVAGAESYQVEVEGITDVSWANYDTTTATTYTSTEREPGHEYTFHVYAQKGAANGASATVKGTTTKKRK